EDAQPPPPSWDPTLEERPAGTADEPPAPPPITVAPPAGVEQSMKFVTATAGEELEIRVAATPVAGFEWRLELVGDLLEILDNQFEGGEMPCQRVRLVARGAGAATLSCTYASMIDGRTAAIRTYIVRVAAPA